MDIKKELEKVKRELEKLGYRNIVIEYQGDYTEFKIKINTDKKWNT